MSLVRELMTPNPHAVDLTSTLLDVVNLMHEHGVRQLPVVDATGRLVGIVTDRDVRLAMTSPLVLHERKYDEQMMRETPVEACMTPDPMSVSLETPAYKAAEMLSAYKFGALPVVDAALKLVGIVTVTDILKHYALNFRPE